MVNVLDQLNNAIAQNENNMHKNGNYFTGAAGETILGIIVEAEPRLMQGTGKDKHQVDYIDPEGGPAFFELEVVRVENKHIQTFGVPAWITTHVASLRALLIKHPENLDGVAIQVAFKVLPNGKVVMNTFKEIDAATAASIMEE